MNIKESILRRRDTCLNKLWQRNIQSEYKVRWEPTEGGSKLDGLPKLEILNKDN